MRLFSESDAVIFDGLMPKQCSRHTECETALVVEFLFSVLFYGIKNKTEHSERFEVCCKHILNHV